MVGLDTEEDTMPKGEPPKPRQTVAWSFTLAITAVIVLGTLKTPLAMREPGYREYHPAEGLEVSLIPSTFYVENRQPFRLKARRDFDPTCGRVSVAVPGLGYEQNFTRKEILDGVSGGLNPSQAGSYTMQFKCGLRQIGTAALTVVLKPGGRAPAAVRARRWVLFTGPPVYRDDAFFQVPAMIRLEQQAGRDNWVPVSTGEDIGFVLREEGGQLATTPDMVVTAHTAISAPAYVPFPPGARYSLIAFGKKDGKATNRVQLDWRKDGPKLSLIVNPAKLDLYAAPISTAVARIYLADNGFRVKPAESVDVLVAGPQGLRSRPADRIPLTPQDPYGSFEAGSATHSGAMEVQFTEPRTAVSTAIAVNVHSPLPFLLVAMASGLLGVVVARQQALFQQSRLRIALELITAVLAAYLLYAMNLQAWLKPVGLTEFTLSYLAAASIGLIGGFLGLAVFRTAAALFP